jgi:hypothetical protein
LYVLLLSAAHLSISQLALSSSLPRAADAPRSHPPVACELLRAAMAAVAAADERAADAFACLPLAVVLHVFTLLPVDARARAAAVCKTWCNALAERSLWTILDLSLAGGVARERVTDALLRGAAAKARSGLTALDVSGCEPLTHATLLDVVTANAGALTELRAYRGKAHTPAKRIKSLLAAAPLLRVCHADAEAAAEVACRMLRNEPPFGPLRVRELCVSAPWLGGEADVHALAADMTASASPLSQLLMTAAPLSGQGVLDAVVDVALARRLHFLALGFSPLSAACVPTLARLPGGSALRTLFIHSTGAEPLLLSGEEGSASLLAAALRANSTLTALSFIRANVWLDAAAAGTLLQALTAHPSVQKLLLFDNVVRAADRARVGASLGALVAANASALQLLDVSDCALGDEGLGPLVDALAANTHLRVLVIGDDTMSDAFALERLQPALLANTSLCRLTLSSGMPGLRGLETLVRQRAAARAAAASVASRLAATQL